MHGPGYYYVGKDPALGVMADLPFMMNVRQRTAWLIEGNGQTLINEYLDKMNVYTIPGGNTGAQMGGWFRKEIKTLADLQGLKFRIAGLAGQVMAKLGAVPQQIAGGDIYPALERGTIDAAEWVGPYDDEKLGFVKVAPYYYYPGFWEGAPAIHFWFGKQKWAELPKAYKAVANAAAAYAATEMVAKYDARNPAALRRLVGAGGAAAAVQPGDPGGGPQGLQRAVRRDFGQEPGLQETVRVLQDLPQRRVSVVAGGRVHLRQLHDPGPPAQLTGGTSLPPCGRAIAFGQRALSLPLAGREGRPIPATISAARTALILGRQSC